MRYGIVGSRRYPKLDDVEVYVRSLPRDAVVVSGGADGVDKQATAHATALGMEVVEYYPDYAEFGRRAPLERNTLIVEDSDKIIAFWDGTSAGTIDTVAKARERGIPVTIVMATKVIHIDKEGNHRETDRKGE